MGRGCLVGPLVAAAVILPPVYATFLIKDSKKLTPTGRVKLADQIMEDALDWAIGFVTPREIDKLNVLNASHLAMHRAISQLRLKATLLLIDGNRFKSYQDIPHTCLVRGDVRCSSIAAASIIAKVHRDKYMQDLGKLILGYGWEANKGYPTRAHRKAIAALGMSIYHLGFVQLSLANRLDIS